jgi:hypothetical protein
VALQLLIARHNGIAVLLDTMRNNVTDASVQATHRLNRARTAVASRPDASTALRRTYLQHAVPQCSRFGSAMSPLQRTVMPSAVSH